MSIDKRVRDVKGKLRYNRKGKAKTKQSKKSDASIVAGG